MYRGGKPDAACVDMIDACGGVDHQGQTTSLTQHLWHNTARQHMISLNQTCTTVSAMHQSQPHKPAPLPPHTLYCSSSSLFTAASKGIGSPSTLVGAWR